MAASRDLLIRLIAKDEASKEISGVENSLAGLGKAAAALGIGLSAGALAKGVYDLTVIGAQAQQVEQSFESLSRSAGQSGDKLLEALKVASRGTISETELMQKANFAMLAGGNEMANALPQLLEIARAASIGLGEDMGFMFDSIVKGIARGSPLILDNLGLIVSLEEANKKYADSLGVSVSALTEQQKQQALLNDILSQAPDYIASVGAESTTAAEKVVSMSVAMDELKAAIGTFLVEAGTADFVGNIAGEITYVTDRFRDFGDVAERFGTLEAVKASAKLAKALQDLGYEFKRTGMSVAEYNKRWEEATDLYQYLPEQLQYTKAVMDSMPAVMGALSGAIWDVGKAANFTGASLRTMATMANGLSPTQYQARTKKAAKDFAADYEATMREAQRASSFAADESARAWERSFANMRSMAEQVLGGGLNVTDSEMLAAGAGTYQDKPLEAARRLADVANLGLESPWASFFEIPQSVLDQGTEAIKAWAAATRDDVVNLTRPDLIDWDAFIANYEKLLNDNAARELTIDIAVGKLSDAGLLQGNDAQRKAQVAKLLGIETPEIAVASMVSGFDAALSSNNPADKVLSNVKSGVDADLAGYATIGKTMGDTIGTATKTAIIDNVGNVRTSIAHMIAPEVARILATNAGEAQP